ncbi:MAG: CinA family nicotinamide mononucleotide deamidase-related protein [Dehalococcoidia bacterium]|jgi:nicotinamide-nucleotide amidase
MKAEIISIGTELLLGEITDLNAAYLASQLPLLGLDLHFISTVGDNQQRLIETLSHAWQRSDIIITTGGLGPTEDDITREAIADFFKEPISVDHALVEQFKAIFKQFNIDMPESNIKQAYTIPSCRVIPNPRGTAPGWWVERDEHVVIAMPGPPGEMQQMWTNVVAPKLRDKYGGAIIFSSTLKTFSLSEAKVGEITRAYLQAQNPTVGIYAKPDGIQLRIAAKSDSLEKAKKLVDATAGEIRKLLGDYIWGTDSDTLEGLTADFFVENKLTLSTMEAGTGGILANNLTNNPNSSKFYKCGIVFNRNISAMELFVNKDIIVSHGTASREAAGEMAAAARKNYGTSVGVGLIGILGSDELDAKLGTTVVGIDNGKHNYTFQSIFPGTRLQIKQRAAISALFELRKIMLQEIKCT